VRRGVRLHLGTDLAVHQRGALRTRCPGWSMTPPTRTPSGAASARRADNAARPVRRVRKPQPPDWKAGDLCPLRKNRSATTSAATGAPSGTPRRSSAVLRRGRRRGMPLRRRRMLKDAAPTASPSQAAQGLRPTRSRTSRIQSATDRRRAARR
jgi:hypothetical protein